MSDLKTVYDAMQNRGLTAGQLVVSLAGHDRGRIYLVVEVRGSFVFCVDGYSRVVDKPKRKRWRHVRPLGQLQPGWSESLAGLKDNGQKNALIRKLIENHSGWTQVQSAD